MNLVFPSRKSVSSRAFTLIEVMVAMAITAVALTALYASTSFGFSLIKSTRENLNATQILMDHVETMRLHSYDVLLNDRVNLPLSQPTNWNSLGIVYNVDMAIETNLPGFTYGSDMMKVTLTVTWTNDSGRIQSRKTETYVCKTGIQGRLVQ